MITVQSEVLGFGIWNLIAVNNNGVLPDFFTLFITVEMVLVVYRRHSSNSLKPADSECSVRYLHDRTHRYNFVTYLNCPI